MSNGSISQVPMSSPYLRERSWRIATLALILLLVAGLYSHVLSFQFVYDDTNLILKNPRIHDWNGVFGAFSSAMWSFEQWTANAGFYRPVTAMAQTTQWMLFGPEPMGFHASSLVLHLMLTSLVFGLALRLQWPLVSAAISAVIVGIHPLVIQPTAWVSAISDPLSVLLVFTALLLFARAVQTNRYWRPATAGWILVLLASLTLERAWLLVPLFGLYQWSMSDHLPLGARIRLALRDGMFFLSAIATAIAIRLLNIDASPALSTIDWTATLLSVPSVALAHVAHFIYPFELSIAYDDQLLTEPTLTGFLLPLGLLVILAVAGYWITQRTARRSGGVFGLMAFYLLLTGSVGGTFTPGDLIQDRYVYSAIICCALWIGSMVPNTLPDTQLVQVGAAMLLVWGITLFLFHTDNLHIWSSNQALYERAVSRAPNKPRYLLNLSNTLRRENGAYSSCALLERARLASQQGAAGADAVKIAFSLGNCYRDSEKPNEASAAYDEAFIASNTRFLPAWENKVLLWLNSGHPERALDAANAITENSPQYGRGWHLMGVAAATLRDWDTAERAFRRALVLDPTDNASQTYLVRVQSEIRKNSL